MERRKILLKDNRTGQYQLIITDAPSSTIKNWSYRYNEARENGTYGKEVKLFDTIKNLHYVKVLLDSETDKSVEREDVEIIGYDEMYNLHEYLMETIEREIVLTLTRAIDCKNASKILEQIDNITGNKLITDITQTLLSNIEDKMDYTIDDIRFAIGAELVARLGADD